MRHSFFSNSQQGRDWQGKIEDSIEQMEMVCRTNPTASNESALRAIKSLQQECVDAVQNASSPSPTV